MRNIIIIAVGAVIILCGVLALLGRILETVFSVFWSFIPFIVSIVFSLIVVAIGIVLIVVTFQKASKQSKSNRLFRSTSNKKIAGVCGGIAVFFGIDPVVVRIIAIVLGLVSFYLIVPLYLILWIAVPPDTRTFDTWT